MARIPYRLLVMPPEVVGQPFTEGMITDAVPYVIGPRNSSFAQDAVAPNAVISERRGWAFYGALAIAAGPPDGIWRGPFVLSGFTTTYVTVLQGGTGTLWLQAYDASSGATTVFESATGQADTAIPRCVYHDEVMVCFQDGVTPMLRTSGLSGVGSSVPDTPTFAVGKGTLTISSGSFDGTTGQKGGYVGFIGGSGTKGAPPTWYRIVEANSTTSLTLEDVRATVAQNVALAECRSYGRTYPTVSVYSAGTVTVASNAATGTGTKWTSAAVSGNDGLLLAPIGANAEHGPVFGNLPITDTGLTTRTPDQTNVSYAITRACPFKDAASHRGSLWGAGVKQYPTRVYVSPKGWNPSVAPGFPLSYDPSAAVESADPNDFLLDFVDVPAETDGDPIVALLTSPNPLLILKTNSVYGIYGEHPNLVPQLIASGIGCIDIRSAISTEFGQFWAGSQGIYRYVGNQIVDLTQGRINNEWRDTVANHGAIDYCTAGVAYGHLVVSIKPATIAFARTYVCDLRTGAWISRFTNSLARATFSARVPGEPERLLFATTAQGGRLMDLYPAIAQTGASTASDGDGHLPHFQVVSGAALFASEGIEEELRLLDIQIHAEIYDIGAVGATQLTPYITSADALGHPVPYTKQLAALPSGFDVGPVRFNRRVDRPGRRFQLTLDKLQGANSLKKLEVAQVVLNAERTMVRT